MRYKNTVLIVQDLDRSKAFYRHILDLKVLLDFHGRVTLSSGIVLESYEIWKDLIHKDDNDIVLLNHASEFYFEIDDIDAFMIKLNEHNVPLIHPLKEHTWGQRTVRFYDPDGHVIEVGETLKKVVKRYLSQGLSYEEAANKIGIPVDYIKHIHF